MFLTFSALVLLLLPFAALGRGLAAQIGLASVSWLCIAALTAAMHSGWLSGVMSGFEQPSLHDTYYVVGRTHYDLGAAAILALLAASAWLARPVGLASVSAFWLLHAALAASVLPQMAPLIWLPHPPTADYLAIARRLEIANTIGTIGSGIALLAFCVLLACILWPLGARLFTRR